MDIYNNICRYVTMPLWAAWEKSDYLKHYKYLCNFQYLSEDQILDYQFHKIKNIVNHAYFNCKYYYDLYSSNNIHPSDIKCWKDFYSLPVINKDSIRNNIKSVVANNYSYDTLVKGKTSGSTGKPLDFYIDQDATQKQRAIALMTNEWAGYKIGSKMYTLFGQSTSPSPGSNIRKLTGYIRKICLDRITNLSTLKMSPETMMLFSTKLAKTKNPFIIGYAHTLYLFSEFLEDNGINDITSSGIISGGMVLHKWQRNKIEKILHSKVINRYGCEELGTIACECNCQEGFHINSYSKYVEILNNRCKRLSVGQIGSIVITDLSNFGMPFIRYKIEDMGILSCNQCSCGRTLPLLSSLEGRESDFVIRPDGTLVSGISLTDNFGANITGVKQIQIIQNCMDHIIIRIVKSSDFGESSCITIEKLVKLYFGNNMRYDLIFVDGISFEKSGKIRFVISNIDSISSLS